MPPRLLMHLKEIPLEQGNLRAGVPQEHMM